MRIASIVLASALIFGPYQIAIAGKPYTQDNRVNLTVTRFDDHVSIPCKPENADTSVRTQWKAICNEMALAQVSKLVADGAIEAISGPVFDKATIESATTQLLRTIPLSQPQL